MWTGKQGWQSTLVGASSCTVKNHEVEHVVRDLALALEGQRSPLRAVSMVTEGRSLRLQSEGLGRQKVAWRPSSQADFHLRKPA